MRLFGRRRSAAAPTLLMEAPFGRYLPLRWPDTDVMSMLDPEWLDREMRARRPPQVTLAAADQLAMSRITETVIGPDIKALTEALLLLLPEQDRAALRASTFDAVFTGVACAILEEESEQARAEMMHPSIANALRVAGMEEQYPSEQAALVADKAREGGYFWMRQRTIAPESIFVNCNFST